jgi:hypothetical protein
MKKIFAGFILPLLILSFTCLSSCKNSASKQQKTAETQEKKELQSQIETHVYPLPTSAAVIKKLTELEVGYMIGLTNPVENSKKYFDSQSRAKNLGAYGADLSYTTLYNRMQDVGNYLEVIKSLSNELNMSKVYDENIYTQIRQNVDNKDELVKILTKEFNDTYSFLYDNDEQPLALLIVGGAWVEGMYLTTHVSEAAYQNPEFSRVLLDQKESFNTYLEITKPYLNDANVAAFVKLLDPVKKVYEGLGTSLTEQNIKDITKVVVDLREQVVK